MRARGGQLPPRPGASVDLYEVGNRDAKGLRKTPENQQVRIAVAEFDEGKIRSVNLSLLGQFLLRHILLDPKPGDTPSHLPEKL